jgi:hypothetical protein
MTAAKVISLGSGMSGRGGSLAVGVAEIGEEYLIEAAAEVPGLTRIRFFLREQSEPQ